MVAKQEVATTDSVRPQNKFKRPFALSSGSTVYLNEMEVFVAKGLLGGGSLDAMKKAWVDKFDGTLKKSTVSELISRPWVRDYFHDLMRADAIWNRYSGEDGKKIWLMELIQMRNQEKVDFTKIKLHEMIGEFMGYRDQGNGIGDFNQNIQINILQRSGER